MIKKLSLSAIMLFVIALTGYSQLLWKISGNGAKGTSYLFGTHHLVAENVIDSIPGFKKALDEVDVVMAEIDMQNINMSAIQRDIMKRVVAPKDSLLTMVLTPQQIDSVNVVLKKYSGGLLSIGSLKSFKPIMVTLQLAVLKAANNLENVMNIGTGQLDTHIQQLASSKDIPVEAFETIEQQMDFLFGSPIKEQVKDLMQQVNEDAEDSRAATLENAYFSGNIKEIERILDESYPDKSSEGYHRMFLDRNNAWIERMREELPQRKMLVVVGAAHLVGDDGLIAKLKKAGYKVKAVKK